MSDRMTSVRLPGTFGSGLAMHGRLTPVEMIAAVRRKAEQDKAMAEAILAAPDEHFRVETYIGVHARRHRETLQESALKTDQHKQEK